jgi:signal transduction histidine kinase
LDIRKAVDPILDAGLSFGASAARIVLNDAMIPELGSEPRSTFWKGDSASKYYHLDRPLLDMNKSQELVVLTNPARARMLNLENTVAPESLIASAIRSENQFYGTLWLAFENPHAFSDEEQRFVTTIASQAALAAENARLFLTAEVEQQRLSAVLASTPDAVLVTDQSGRVLVMNPMAAQLLLSSSQTASRGKLISDVIRQREILDLLSSEQQSVQTREITLTNGKTYMASATPVIADETVLGRVCVLRDVTYLKELDEIKSEFVATVSHDLRSPLTLMRGYATMLDMVGDLNDQQKGYISKIITGVENMSKLVSNLLDLGRIEAGVGLNLEMVPIVDVIKQVKDQLQLQATQKQIELAASYPPQAMPLVEGDPALLRQAIQNLIENAIKYTNSEGRVNVKLVVNPHSDSVLFTVQDTGIGIAPVDQPRLFERFFRAAKRETRSQTGTGLGLAIVKSIAERHNGRVWVKSQLGKGSEFYLEIPLRQPIGVRT